MEEGCRSDRLGHLWLVSGTGKQTNDDSPCLRERSHHLDPHTPELQPQALAFLSIALQLSWWYKEGDYSPQGVKKGHVLKRISRERGAMNVEPSQA